MTLARSFATISGLTLLSRIFGFVRDILMAAIMGAGLLTDVFLVAFKLPNFFRRLFAEGAFNAAFVPMFSGTLTAEGKEKAKEFAERILAILLLSLLIFVAIMEITMPWAMMGLAPGFIDEPEKFDLAVVLTRITFPYLLFISLVSLFGGVLNSLGRFGAVASAPILLNLCLIGSLLWLKEFTETPAHALAYGVALAGIVQFIWVAFAAYRASMLLHFRLPRLSPEVKEFLRRMAPGIVGAGVVQINLLVDVIIATLIPTGSITYLYYADRINQLPLSLIGTAMGVALLPALSKQIKENKMAEALKSQNHALELVLFFAIPATVALMVMPEVIISVLFEHGEFRGEAVLATSIALMAYAVGLPAFVMAKIFAATFFASGDTKTPVKIAIICLITNVILNLNFIWLFPKVGYTPFVGLALATSLSSWLNVVLLSGMLLERKLFKLDPDIKKRLFFTTAAALAMGALLFFAQQVLSSWIAGPSNEKILALIILTVLGALSFFVLAYLSGGTKLGQVRRLLGKKAS